ncbi:YqaJ viral recombinase family protein [Streptomyces sp. NPDC093586]|uniref:YqaJ viral recombinase family protein n=1 Tax=Streptomyces sp. NPDC093586 TaxID=3366042 RepID=UPI003806A2E3
MATPRAPEEGEAAYWGTVNEENVVRRWAMQNRNVIRRVGLVAHVDHPHWTTTLDRRVTECPLDSHEQAPCALETKTRSAFKSAQWHAGASDDVTAQVLWQIAVNGYEHMHYAVLIGGNDYHQGTIRTDQYTDVIADITTTVDKFWFEHAQAQVPPGPAGDGEALTKLFRRLHPARSGAVDIARHDDALDALDDYNRHQHAEMVPVHITWLRVRKLAAGTRQDGRSDEQRRLHRNRPRRTLGVRQLRRHRRRLVRRRRRPRPARRERAALRARRPRLRGAAVSAEALDTIWALGRAFAAWLTVLAALTTLVLYALVLIAWGTARLAWRTIRRPDRPTWARGRYAAARWARHRPDYEEAA